MAAQEDEAVMPQRPSVWPTSTQGVEEGSRTYSSAGRGQRVASELPLSQGKDSVVVQSVSRVRVSGTLWMQHTRLLCPPLSPEVCSNSCPLSW